MFTFAMTLLWEGVREARLHGKPEAIIYSSPHPFGFLSCWMLARLTGAQLCFEVRDIWPLSLIEIAKVSRWHPLVWLTSLVERFAYKSADRVVSLLPSAHEHMARRGLSAAKFVWIPNGISREALERGASIDCCHDSEIMPRIRSLQASGKVVFLYAGAHGEPNAMHRFLDAAVLLEREGFERAAFVLIGKGEQKQELVDRAKDERLSTISFYGQRSKEEVLALMRAADVGFFVMHPLPIYRFGVSLNKLFDYMSCGLPVLSAYSAGNDPVREANCGLSVPAGNPEAFVEAVKAFCSMSRTERQEMGQRGRAVAEEQYSYAVLAASYAETCRRRK